MSRLFRRGHTADSANHQPGSGLHRKRAPTLPSTPGPTSPQSSKTELALPTDSSSQRSPSLSSSPASHTTARERFPEGAEHQSVDISLSDTPGSTARKGSYSSSALGPPSPRSMSSAGRRDSGDETEIDDYEVGKKKSTNSGKRAEILAKRFGEDSPFVLPHDTTSQIYPGVVIGSFASGNEGDTFAGGVGFDGSMDEIMDTSATPQAVTRQGSTSGQAGANIAPWLSDDTPGPGLSHHTSVPVLPKLQREESSRSRNGSQPSISSVQQAQNPDFSARSRMASQESISTLGNIAPLESTIPLPGGGRHHPSGRASRYGSTVSNISAGGSIASDKRKGFLGGLLKRKTGQSVSQAPSDFAPLDGGHRGSGSASSRLSSSTSYSSLSSRQPVDIAPARLSRIIPRQSFVSEDLVSPLHEIGEPEFTLDMNLDDMEGIVDQNLANAPPAPSSRTSQAPTLASSVVQQDCVGSFASSSQSGSGGSGASASSRAVVAPTERETFTRPNPFGGSPQGSMDGKARTPPSPHTLTLSPKHFLPPGSQPRRPSQLRNVKMGSVDSETSLSESIQPLSPAWAAGPPGMTLFHDPFGSSSSAPQQPTEGLSPLRAEESADQAMTSNAAALAAAAAWAAPESWGVEADDEPEDPTSSDEEEWAQAEEMATAPSMDQTRLQPSPSASSRKPPPFGHKSMGANGQRPGTNTTRKGRTRTANGRPNSAARPTTATRPGTSGSTNVSTVPHYIRIYTADGSYNVMDFPLNTTTTEIINVLSNAGDGGKKASTNMRLYLRAGGQDRQLLPSEKPLTIQDRRLRQAGYTEAEHLEELGKEDLFTLFKLIFQTPNLPVMNPEEESTYDSFEFIDVAARDLLTIPIFLHLHAHNIIILNVSKNPMSDIPLDFVQACASLKELRMSYMALKRIPTSICASTTLSRLDVSCNRIADLENVPLHEIRTLLSLKVQNNKLTSIPSYFAQMKALKYLNISNNKFETFPPVVSEMSNLVDLDVSFNDIAELPSEMSNLKSLERLAAFGNELVTFPASFSTLANLRALDVRRNKLTDLNSVYALPNLTTLQADNNNLVTLDAQLGAKVRQFSVPHNSITRFTLAPQLSVAAVTYSLTRLDLSHGKISILADEAFSGLVNLIELNLSFNQFTRLPSTIGDLVNLQVMLLTDNMLESLPPIGRLQKLRVLNIHNNNMTEFPGSIWACGSLEHLNASSNLFKDIPPPPPIEDIIEWVGEERATELNLYDSQGSSLLPISISLKYLQMADNRFTDDVFHYIADSRNLQSLNLSFNDIFEIPSGTLSRFDKLEQLYLSGNKLTTLPAEDLEKLQRLKVLHLNGNKLQTLPSELGALGALQHLDVGSNVLKYNIANWPYDWNWNWNTALKYLNLSGNKRLEIKPTSAQDMSHASSFRKDLSDFTALTQLRVLGLMDVTLRIPSLPDESDEKRVRTSFSDINNMAYGISDMVGSQEHLAMFDLVVPNFRGKDNECLFGMFGRAMTSSPAGKIPKFLQESFGMTLSTQLDRLGKNEAVTEALRRTFLSANRATFQHLMGSNGRKQSVTSVTSVDSMFRNWSPSPTSHFRQGCSGAVVYLVDKTLHVGNVGDCLVVISRKGEAELLSKYHDPTDREETARIRAAEAWVSTKGYVNDEKDIDISRAMGYFHHHPAVNASPEIRTRELSESDEFVIIGNHALWKCCSYQTAVDIARTERDDPMMAAQKLRDFAISYGAEGSVMVMVVNVSDVFYSRLQRPRGASGPAPADDGFSARDKRNIRRRYEEVGDRTLNRLQQEIEPPQGQVAIVFTDIVNSTHLWETNPGMPTAIKMHHTFMRRQLRLDGGYEVKTEGDSFMVSFQTVSAALLWAFNCQIGLLQQEWPRELLEATDGKIVYDSEGNLVQRGLRVRMGVHWGAPQCERDPITRRMDYYGPMVNRAARINASADGGQLMASQDVINEIQALRELVDTMNEAELSDMPAEMKREVAELKRIGYEVKDMGERKLKGLEVPEKLHLLYPKSLAGRFEISGDLRANVEVHDARTIAAEPRLIDINEVRELSKLVLRLEAISATQHVMPGSPIISSSMEMTPSRRSHTRGVKLLPPAYLGPNIEDEMDDEELGLIIESLTTRLENTLSTLYLKHLGGFSSVLAALEQATRIDPKLIVHALALMNGQMGQ